MKVFYSEDYILMKHSIDATRKPAWIAESLRGNPMAGIQLVSPTPATKDQIARVHGDRYINAVEIGRPRKLAESCTFPWDAGTWTAELASCGGMIAACESALTDGVGVSLSCGFHHATRDRGSNHCVFNGLAIAMMEMRHRGIERILCIDLDAHCGGGTYSLMKDASGFQQLDVSLFWTDKYQPGEPSTLDLIDDSSDYLRVLTERLEELSAVLPGIQLCLLYAGMDPHEGSGFGGLPGISTEMLRQRDEMVLQTLRRSHIPVAIALGGGYLGPGLDRGGLVDLHRTTIEVANLS